MPIEILMPALSPTMEEGTLAKWLVKEGDEVQSGDVIAEIETDKATMEFEAVDEGTMGPILVAEGAEGVKVNTAIAVLLEDGEDAGDVQVSTTPADTPAPAAAPSPTGSPTPGQSCGAFSTTSSTASPTPTPAASSTGTSSPRTSSWQARTTSPPG